MSIHELSKRYAKALLSVTKDKKNHETVLSELNSLGSIFSENEVEGFFDSPMITQEQKTELIKKVLSTQKVSDETTNLMVLLAKNGRLSAFAEIAKAYQTMIDSEAGVTRGVVRAARNLSAEAQKEIEVKIAQTLKKKIVLTFKEDSSVLGGVVADVGGWTFDDSIESHLRRLNEDLMKH